ncbi:hypothetical protein A2U01_0072479, partial [Trifolium medium]|nr:hypothetical protein [Trifolium medium]
CSVSARRAGVVARRTRTEDEGMELSAKCTPRRYGWRIAPGS